MDWLISASIFWEMNRKDIKKYFYRMALAVYLGFVLVFLLRNIFAVVQEPQISAQSQIPRLSISELSRVSASLENREKLIYPEKLDLSEFQFGKTEPFVK